MNDPFRVRVTGPLAPYAVGFREDLLARGYAPASAAVLLQLMAQLSRWLGDEGFDVGGLTADRIERFFELRRERVRVLFLSPRSLRLLFEHLDRVGVLPAADVLPVSADQLLVERYGRFLLRERALAAGTVRRYQDLAVRFLAGCAAAGVEIRDVDGASVDAFLGVECKARSSGWAKCVASGLRVWLRFLHREELICVSLADVVPSPAGWAASSLPKALRTADLAAVLGACDQQTVVGRRDFAVLVLAARLGLRAGEIAGLDLADIDWTRGEVRVRGKGRRIDVLPLPADVGRALAGYVRGGRPLVQDAFFRRVGAPRGPLHPSTVTGIVYRACDRAGVPRAGAHRLRHTAATQMLRAGASLPEISQVLRHRSPNTTAIYAKVDRVALLELARPWPGCGR